MATKKVLDEEKESNRKWKQLFYKDLTLEKKDRILTFKDIEQAFHEADIIRLKEERKKKLKKLWK